MIGRRMSSTPYCLARARPRSIGIQVPTSSQLAGWVIEGKKSNLTLVFAVATLDLFMLSLLHFPLQNSCSLRLVETGYFQDLSRVQIRVRTSAHNRDIATDHLVYRPGNLVS